MLPPIAMLTTKKRAQIFLSFSLGILIFATAPGCAPSGARALLKGERLMKEGKFSEAVAKFQEATKALPENAKAWNHLGLGYQYAGDPKKAAQAYQQALSLDRNLATARYNLGLLHLEQGNLSDAIIQLTTFTALDSKNPDGWLKLGEAQMQLAGQVSAVERNRLLDAAKKNLEAAQKLHSSAEAQNALGMIQMQRGRVREAVPYFSAALQEDPSFAPALLNLAVIYDQYLNDHRLALMNYQQFLRVAGNSADAPQVQIAVRQLESELNPRPVAAVSPKPSAPTPAAPTPASAPVTVASKEESNTPKVVATPATPKPAPTIVATPKPPPPRKEPPVEVARVTEDAPLKLAQDVAVASTPKRVVESNVEAASPKPMRETKTHEKDSGVLSKLNPASWFKRKPQPVDTEMPGARPNQEAADADSETASTSAPRYPYRSPKRPPEGNRAQAQALFVRGVKAQREKRVTDAIADYREALKLDPAYFEANYNLALAAREVGDLSASLHAYELALAITPDSINARYNFAFTLQEKGYFHDAVNELRKIVAQNPNETRAHLLLGNLYAQRLGLPAIAREHYLKVLETEPQHPQGTQIRYWLAAHP